MPNAENKIDFGFADLIISMVAILSIGCCLPVLAKSEVTSTPPLIKKSINSGSHLIKTFPAAGGLTGYLLQTGPREFLTTYTVPGHDDVVIVGSLLDQTGSDLSEKYKSTYSPKFDLNKFINRISSSSYIKEGGAGDEAKSIVYAFFDPNCVYCHLLWRQLLPYQKIGLAVKWIPVGIIKPDSRGKAGALIEAKNQSAAFYAMESKFSTKDESGAIAPKNNLSKETEIKISSNEKLFYDLGFKGTPALIYRASGGGFRYFQGLPKSSQLPEITNLPAQEIDDSDLKKIK
ncbi:thiol:disulfide interchange protein DsbG [Burkholderia glumae]|uniref:thiol:disulfide interchange protein DsbG n=1 Tax=Burkholderia glumae TaxID=337 RepID=UPI00148ECFBF|nr:thiol:disulfide interchange protein DsbG [Burkholderia glumae]QJW80075.1 thiol:disulfide interchange protein DsbG [Burkholderia glumae]